MGHRDLEKEANGSNLSNHGGIKGESSALVTIALLTLAIAVYA